MRKVAFVRPTPEQRTELTEWLERDPLNGRQRRHFQVLLADDEGGTDEQDAAATGASRSTVERARRQFAAEGLEAALTDKPRNGAPAESDPIPPAVPEAPMTATRVWPPVWCRPDGRDHGIPAVGPTGGDGGRPRTVPDP
jgi:hypothetical protein